MKKEAAERKHWQIHASCKVAAFTLLVASLFLSFTVCWCFKCAFLLQAGKWKDTWHISGSPVTDILCSCQVTNGQLKWKVAEWVSKHQSTRMCILSFSREMCITVTFNWCDKLINYSPLHWTLWYTAGDNEHTHTHTMVMSISSISEVTMTGRNKFRATQADKKTCECTHRQCKQLKCTSSCIFSWDQSLLELARGQMEQLVENTCNNFWQTNHAMLQSNLFEECWTIVEDFELEWLQ